MNRNYVEYKVDEFSGWATLGISKRGTIAVEGGGVFGTESETCALFYQGETKLRTSVENTTLPVSFCSLSRSSDVIG